MNLPRGSENDENSTGQHRAQLLAAQSKDEALRVAIAAAEAAMQAMKLAADPSERDQCSAKLEKFLAEAETIKKSDDWRASISAANGHHDGKTIVTAKRELKEPQSSRQPSKQEQILVLKASYLHGFKFPPWTTTPDAKEFELRDGEALFTDLPDLPLSEMQEDTLSGWLRPSEALPPRTWPSTSSPNPGPSMSFTRRIDLVQDAATDCSVVASLCAGVARAEKGHAKLMRSVLHPYSPVDQRPVMSANGKYIVRLNFNGCYRRVVIDDRLPTSSTTRIIHVVDRHNPSLLWPALLEKAYLKVRGGYDFPGSNSGTDIWILSGWIPEQVFLQSDELEPENLWRRIANAFKYGDVLVTMGTGKMSCKTERELGLAGEHDYAVLDLKEVDGQRLLLVKNPWCEGPNWRGKLNGSSGGHGQEADANAILEEINDGEPVQSSRDLLNKDDQLSPGTFWMDIENVIQHYESIYLNWNPGLFAYRKDLHFAWDLTPLETGLCRPRGTSASLSRHPQYTVTPETAGTVWVLLCRHFQNAVPPDATDDEIQRDRYGIELSGHMSLNAFRSKGRRVLLPDKAVEKGPYVDSPQTLLKLECAAGESITLVPAEQQLPAIRHTFTISAFSNAAVTLADALTRYAYAQECTGAWTKDTAGGNAHSPTYSTNPQFSLTTPRRTNLSLLLESTSSELNVHFKLVHSNGGKRVHAVRNKDILIDSKDYRRGCCGAEFVELLPGSYTVVCSTFEPGQHGDFTLLVESDEKIQTVLLPREGAGRIRLTMEPAAFNPGCNRIAAPLVPQRLVRMYAVARYLNAPERAGQTASTSRTPIPRPLIRLSLEVGRGPERRTLISSNEGEFSDSSGGIRTEDLDLRPDMRRFGEILIVLERMQSHAEEEAEERLEVELFVDQPNAVGWGRWQEFED